MSRVLFPRLDHSHPEKLECLKGSVGKHTVGRDMDNGSHKRDGEQSLWKLNGDAAGRGTKDSCFRFGFCGMSGSYVLHWNRPCDVVSLKWKSETGERRWSELESQKHIIQQNFWEHSECYCSWPWQYVVCMSVCKQKCNNIRALFFIRLKYPGNSIFCFFLFGIFAGIGH